MENWIRLFELADKLNALKPWSFLFDYEILGVKDPVTGTTGFISFAAADDDDPAMSVYLGERALKKLFDFSDYLDTMSPETILEIPQLNLSFCDHQQLKKQDRGLIKAVGRKYAGKKAWPIFRSFTPGMFPWFLDDAEQKSMIHFLEQALEVTSRPDATDFFRSEQRDRDLVLIREYTNTGDYPSWKDSFQHLIEMPALEIPVDLPAELIRGLTAIPACDLILETDFIMTPARIGIRGTRPYASYILVITDHNSGNTIGFKCLDPSNGIEPMHASIPAIMLELLIKAQVHPKEIHVASEVLIKMATAFSEATKVPLIMKSFLPKLEIVRENIMRSLSD